MRVVTFLFIIINFSCTSHQEISSKNDCEFYPEIADTSVYKKTLLKERSENNGFFNLPNLFSGTNDSSEVRIWPWEAFYFWKQVFIFKIDTAGWHGYHYFSYTLPIIDQEGKTMIFSDTKKVGDSVFLVKEIIPACGWEKFSDSMNLFSVRTLPTQSLIENFKPNSVTDGGGVDIEIATNKSYRFISYYNPEIYSYEECKKISGFMKMLERQLGTDYSWPQQSLRNNHISYKN
jgi:hypothetical protein